MNWFKSIKLAFPVMEKPVEKTKEYPTYLDIGHRAYEGLPVNKGCKEFVWIFAYGQLKIKPVKYVCQGHGVFTGGDISNATYSGKAEQCKDKTKISLHPRTAMSQFKEIPDILLSQLYDRFGVNTEIYVM